MFRVAAPEDFAARETLPHDLGRPARRRQAVRAGQRRRHLGHHQGPEGCQKPGPPLSRLSE